MGKGSLGDKGIPARTTVYGVITAIAGNLIVLGIAINRHIGSALDHQVFKTIG